MYSESTGETSSIRHRWKGQTPEDHVVITEDEDNRRGCTNSNDDGILEFFLSLVMAILKNIAVKRTKGDLDFSICVNICSVVQ